MTMHTLTIRLSDELEQGLEEEARLSRRPSTELAEEAIAAFLEERRRDRFREALARAANALGRDQEALDLAEEFLPLDNEALELAEAPARKGHTRSRRGARG
jgi:predicted transcriptional regulator